MPRKSKKKTLLDEGEEENGEVDVNAEWTVNENFAKRFTHNKQREDLHRLQELKKKGWGGADSDGSESEDEDEDGLLPSKTDIQIFETLAKIKKKDPIIYQPDVKFYDEVDDEEEDGNVETVEKKKKPLYLKDVQARQLLDGFDDNNEELPKKKPLRVVTYADEQEELKHAFLRSVAEADGDEGDDLLRVRHRTKEELAKDAEETVVAIEEAERRKKDQDISKKLEDYFGKKDDDLDANEKFLKEFFLNEGWIDKDRNRVPSYRDVVGVDEDEGYVEEQDTFEAEYNFRFQENAGAQVMGNPRVVEGSVRKKGEARKSARQNKAERLAEERKAREEELKRLKNLKKKEIIEKLEKIRTVAGANNPLTSIGEDDIEEDFDPNEYDRKMQEAFGDSYYQEVDVELGDELEEDEGVIEKPNFDEEDEELGLPKDWSKKGGFSAVHKAQKVSFKDKIAVDKNLDEYYKLDYEDMIGDLPTRFKYREVKPNTYGLDVADILTADDKELNQHVSIKKLAPYRGEEWEAPKYSTLSQKARKKQALQDGPGKSARKYSNKRPDEKKKDSASIPKESVPEAASKAVKDEEPNGDTTMATEPEGEKKSKKRKRKKTKSGPLSFLTPSRVEAYGALPNPEKKKKKKKA